MAPGKVDKFCDQSTMQGFQFIRSDYRLWFRIFVAIIIAVCLGLTAYQVAQRILYYIKNPVSTETAEHVMISANFPTVVVCSNREIGLTKVLSNLQYKTPDYDISNTTIDLVEMLIIIRSFSDLDEKDKLFDVMEVVKNFSSYAARLREIAEKTENSNDSPPEPVIQDEQMKKDLKEIQEQLKVFPIKVFPWLVRTKNEDGTNWSRQNYYLKNPWLNNTNPQIEECLRLNSILNDHILKSDEARSCYEDWKCSFERAAGILEEIASYDVQTLAKETVQNAQELIVSCAWNRQHTCTFSKIWTSDGLCFKVHPMGKVGGDKIISATRGKALKLVLNLEKYDTVPLLGVGYEETIAKVHLYPPKDADNVSEPGGRKIFSVRPGNHWELAINKIQEVNRISSRCGKAQLRYFTGYTNWKCMWEEESDLLYKSCGCVPLNSAMEPVLESFPAMKHCGLADEIGCHLMSQAHEGHCPLDCRAISYVTDLSSTTLDTRLLPKNPFYHSSWTETKRSHISGYKEALGKIEGSSRWTHDTQILDGLNFKTLDVFHDLLRPVAAAWKKCDSANRVLISEALNGDSSLQKLHKQIADFAAVVTSAVNEIDVISQKQNEAENADPALSIGEWEVLHLRHGTPDMLDFQQTWLKMQKPFGNFVPAAEAEYSVSDGLMDIVQSSDESHFTGEVFSGISTEGIKEILTEEADCIRAVQEEYISAARLHKLHHFFSPDWFRELEHLIKALEKFQPDSEYDRDNLAVVSIYFGEMGNQTITQVPSYDGFGLLADVGGTMGLYLGATVFIFFEILVYLVTLVKESLILKHNQDSEETKERPEEEKDIGRRYGWKPDATNEPEPMPPVL